MLISIMPEEIHKLNDFKLYAQNPNTLLCCGVTNDTESTAVFSEITEIPTGQEQRCLPQSYGIHLNLERIERGLADYTAAQAEAEALKAELADADAALAELGVTV